MTPSEKRYRTRMGRRLRKLEIYAKTVTVVALLLAGLAVWSIARAAEGQPAPREPGQAATQETPLDFSPREAKALTGPLNVEIRAPRYAITQEELEVVARVVHAEAVGEGYDGQALVAQCILNTAEATGKRPDEVVLAPDQYAAPAKEAGEEVKAAVEAVFLDGYQVTEEPVRFFYAPARCESKWHETALEFVLEYGGHRFFKT